MISATARIKVKFMETIQLIIGVGPLYLLYIK